jgi:dihydroflavonol-4-reductase
MRAFVTGSTGFIGARLVRRLVEGGHRVRCLVHRPERVAALAGLAVETVHGDVGDREVLCAAMAGVDWVFHLAAHYEFWSPHPEDYRTVNVDGTRAVLETALEHQVRKVVHMSSFVVYGEPESEPLREGLAEGPERFSRYAESKHEADLVAWEIFRRGLPLVVVYPGAVVGEEDPKAAGQYVRGLIEHRMPARVLERAVFPFVYVGDVAEVLVRAAEKPDNVGARYFAVGENRTFGELNRMVAEISGESLPRLRLPDPVVLSAAAAMTILADLTHRPPLWGMAYDQMRTIKHGVRVDGSKAERELGVRYTPLREALARAIGAPLPVAS